MRAEAWDDYEPTCFHTLGIDQDGSVSTSGPGSLRSSATNARSLNCHYHCCPAVGLVGEVVRRQVQMGNLATAQPGKPR